MDQDKLEIFIAIVLIYLVHCKYMNLLRLQFVSEDSQTY